VKSVRVVEVAGGSPAVVAPARPVRVRRRPAVIFGSVAALLMGAVAGVWLWLSSTSAVEVVAARTTVARGAIISAADLVTVRIGVDPAVQAIPASQAASLVGKRAALDISAGGLVTRADVADQVVPGKGMTLVGLSLGVGLLPSSPLRNGDQVRIVRAPAGQEAATGTPVVIAATVVAASQTRDGQATLVDVLVPSADAPGLAAEASAGKVALVLDSRER
jgi:SAF domain